MGPLLVDETSFGPATFELERLQGTSGTIVGKRWRRDALKTSPFLDDRIIKARAEAVG